MRGKRTILPWSSGLGVQLVAAIVHRAERGVKPAGTPRYAASTAIATLR